MAATISAAAAPPPPSDSPTPPHALNGDTKMGKDLFKNLPSEMIINILLRLPVKTTVICKCVCKPWLNLLATPEFVKYHLSKSKSVPCLAVEIRAKSCKTLEFADGHRSNSVFDFKLPFGQPMHSSVNGLLFLGGCFFCGSGDFILCNPVTREFITLPQPRPPPSGHRNLVETYGFGMSRMSGQYKVVKILIRPSLGEKCDPLECQVYTVGTGSWREVARDTPLRYFEDKQGVFLNGNLHWLVMKLTTNSFSGRISCLDLETEVFSNFSPPPDIDMLTAFRKLSVLRDSLCVSDYSSCGPGYGCKIEIWLMKGYGDEKSWAKEFVIRDVFMGGLEYVWPIKVFEDGGILMEWGRSTLLCYSGETKTFDVEKLAEDEKGHNIFSCFYAPSFVPLKNYAMENVSSF